MTAEMGLESHHRVADVGSGTGIFSKLLLENGNSVSGIEPNLEMRSAAEKILSQFEKFHSCVGSSEKTTLENNSVDFITAAQAFHWFEPQATRKEFQRILKPDSIVVLI